MFHVFGICTMKLDLDSGQTLLNMDITPQFATVLANAQRSFTPITR